MSGPDDQAFLSRWSRLKRERTEPELEPDLPQPDETGAAVEDAPEKTDSELLEELGLPEPESLKPGDDFSAFMSRAVPARLRNRALRKLWLTDPVLANLDELVDYGEDFTDAATVVENLASAWQAGKGYVLEEPEPAPEDETVAEAEAEADPAAEAEGTAEDTDAGIHAAPGSDDPPAAAPDAVPQDEEGQVASATSPAFGAVPDPAPRRPRRMRFARPGDAG